MSSVPKYIADRPWELDRSRGGFFQVGEFSAQHLCPTPKFKDFLGSIQGSGDLLGPMTKVPLLVPLLLRLKTSAKPPTVF